MFGNPKRWYVLIEYEDGSCMTLYGDTLLQREAATKDAKAFDRKDAKRLVDLWTTSRKIGTARMVLKEDLDIAFIQQELLEQ